MLKKAVKDELIAANPLAGAEPLKLLKEPDGRMRYATIEEIDRLLTACERKPVLRSFVLVALNTGMRRSEVLSLTRRSIDWTSRIATLVDTKNGKNRRVLLNDQAYDALKALPTPLADDAPLFPFTANQVSKALARATRRAGLVDFRLHDCRHTFASHQAMSGLQSMALQELLGHKDPRMTARYSHLSKACLRKAVDAVQLGRMSNSEEANAAAKA